MHLAGYKLANGNLSDLTERQEQFVAIAGIEMLNIQGRLAGADIPPRQRRSTGKKDAYGEKLDYMQRMKELETEFLPKIDDYVNKPL